MHKHEAAELCKKHLNKYVLIQMKDGTQYDGIVESVDGENIYLAVPNGGPDPTPMQNRAIYGYPYYGYSYGPYYPGLGYPYVYGGRFRRLVLPLAALAAISLLPYF